MEGGGNMKREGEGHRETESEKREKRREGGLRIWYEREKEQRKGKVRVYPFFGSEGEREKQWGEKREEMG